MSRNDAQRFLFSLVSLSTVLSSLNAVAETSSSHRSRISVFKNGLTHLTVKTPEGIERIALSKTTRFIGGATEAHYQGYTRPRGSETSAKRAALSTKGNKALVFFTSRTTGRPVALSFVINQKSGSTSQVRVYRTSQNSLACGRSVDSHEKPLSAEANDASAYRRTATAQPLMMAAFNPSRVIEIATEADYEFSSEHGSETNSFIRTVLNATDALYTSTLGIRLKIVSQKAQTRGTASTNYINAETLLSNFSNSSRGTRADLRHLFTGRSLEGRTIGIAYIATACYGDGRYSVGLSRSVSPALHPFLAAHEIAHNLSAVHDNELSSVMNPAITPQNGRFSDRSINSILGFVASSGSCLATEGVGHAILEINTTDPTTFDAQVNFNGRPSHKCSVSLFGSADDRRYVQLSTKRIYAQASGQGAVLFRSPLPSLSSNQTFTFYSQVSCAGDRRVTAKTTLILGTLGTSGVSSGKSWLSQLRRSLS